MAGQHRATETTSERQDNLMEEILKRLESLEAGTSEIYPRRKREVKCFKCHEKGHYARECTDPKQAAPSKVVEFTEARRKADNHLNGQGPALAAKGRSN